MPLLVLDIPQAAPTCFAHAFLHPPLFLDLGAFVQSFCPQHFAECVVSDALLATPRYAVERVPPGH